MELIKTLNTSMTYRWSFSDPAKEDEVCAMLTQCYRFPAMDKKGRYIGANVYLWTRHSGKFAFGKQATRNGKEFGACQSDVEFDTLAQRDSAVRAYLEAAEARAIRDDGKR